MAETVDELTVTYEDGGIETVKELDKKSTDQRCLGNGHVPLSGLESRQGGIRPR